MTVNFSDLNARLEGDLFCDRLHRYMLSTDGSIFQKMPACVVYPRTTGDVVETVAFAAANGCSVHPRGAGSGLCGSCLGSGILVDFTRYMNRLVKIDFENKTFACEPGYRFGELEAALAGTGLFFPPDPSSGEYATFGGMAATNASGAHSVKYGNVSDYFVDAEVVLSSGRVIRLAEIPGTAVEDLPPGFQELFRLYNDHAEAIEAAYPSVRCNSSGYNLKGLVTGGRLDLRRLFAGSEGTLGITTRLTFRLAERPAHDSLVVAFFDDIVRSARAVQLLLPMGPSGIEIMDKSLLSLTRDSDPALRDKIPDGTDNVLLIEFDGGDRQTCVAQARRAREVLAREELTDDAHLAVSAAEKQRFWAVRKAAVPILYKLKGSKKILALIEDAAVPTDRLVAYFEGIYRILKGRRVRFVVYGHIAKGLLHTRPLLDLKDGHDVALLRPIADDIFDLVHSLGGTISGEHGDGRLRSAYIRRQYPGICDLFLETKRLMDPTGTFNPEIKTDHDPDQMAKSLRFGARYGSQDLAVHHLRWPEAFAGEVEKCHGCAKCTTLTTATRMCPVYKFTRHEAASPRAKANVLRALVSGAVDNESLYGEAFQEVIAQCVNCGSCHKECPSNVNIPKLALEARAHYVGRYGPGLTDRLLSGVEAGGRFGRKVSGLLGPLAASRSARRLGERWVGISARRHPVVFPARSLFERVRPVEGRGSLRLLYYAGCYAGYIRPEIGQAAVKALVRLGATVYLPPQHCCGLPMLSKGMAAQASAKVSRNLARWGKLVDGVDHVVVTCSSCGLSLAQEWEYLSGDPAARKVRDKVIPISSLIAQHLDRLPLAASPLSVAYHHPCHLKVQAQPDASLRLLRALPGIEVTDLKSHCCGMAGSWGMEARHFELSRRIASGLMGRLADSNAALGATDCPTCRMQMEQFGRTPIVHPVEIVARCICR